MTHNGTPPQRAPLILFEGALLKEGKKSLESFVLTRLNQKKVENES